MAGLLLAPGVQAQETDRMDRERLAAIVREAGLSAEVQRQRLDEALAKASTPRLYSDSLISLREWIGMAEDRPIFRITHNREAAVSSRIHTLLDGGRTALGLSGQGQTVLLIDDGFPRLTHVELTGRVDRRDEFSLQSTHATHVAGTIMAAGIWREARGMAPAARLRSHDWNNDVAEMAQAALDGIRVSNHSYGDPLGWTPDILGDGAWGWMGTPSISEVEDVQFGYYGETARDWDAVADAAAYLLIVKSAGNERERQGPPD
ncbi:MAG: S8 family serine peptidase, partial [Bacteroidetes bacterium]|nr:S8 family serine peptidase [Bacteroidota bacterium]